MKCSLVFVLTLFSLVTAQTIPQVNDYQLLESTDSVVSLIQDAESEVLLATTSLKDKSVAEALHNAMTERGLEVFVLSPKENIEGRANYVQSLALASATVRFGSIGNDFYIIDRQHVVAYSKADSYYFDSETHGRYFASVFRQAFLQGEIYDPLENFEGGEE